MNEITEILNQVKAEVEALNCVNYASVWNGKRVYVNLNGYSARFHGDRTFKIYFDAKRGWVIEKGKGYFSDEFKDSVNEFIKVYNLTY